MRSYDQEIMHGKLGMGILPQYLSLKVGAYDLYIIFFIPLTSIYIVFLITPASIYSLFFSSLQQSSFYLYILGILFSSLQLLVIHYFFITLRISKRIPGDHWGSHQLIRRRLLKTRSTDRRSRSRESDKQTLLTLKVTRWMVLKLTCVGVRRRRRIGIRNKIRISSASVLIG